MQEENLIAPYKNELKANDVVKFFDNVTDASGTRLTKSVKRTRIKDMMESLYQDKESNKTTLNNGKTVPVIVKRRYEKRAPAYYFNTALAPVEEILRAFATKTNIDYTKEKPEPKIKGELIAQEVLHLLDDVKVKGKKVTGYPKISATIQMFQTLYKDKENNACILADGKTIPIIVKRTGENNRIAYYLNSSEHRKEVLRAFALKTDSIYLEYKEEDTMPEDKHPRELTARNCAKLFHKVGFVPEDEEKQEGKERILQWFHRIYSKPEENKVKLPNGQTVDLLVRRISHSQRCLCLNTSDATIKPFVLRRFAELSKSEFCFDNLNLANDDTKELIKSIKDLALAYDKTKIAEQKSFYHTYSQLAFEASHIKTNYITVDEYLRNKASTFNND